MSSKKIIAIVGLMGAGKTTIGFRLANSIKYYFIDSDREIEDFENRSINDIFAKDGEEYFRKIEAQIIDKIIARDENIVLSLGGGAYINRAIRNSLQEKSITIWLYASIDESLKRIGSKKSRPLLNQKNKRETLENLAKIRYPIYENADFKFDTTNLNSEEIVKKIITTLNLSQNV
jgi:shikimate kinase